MAQTQTGLPCCAGCVHTCVCALARKRESLRNQVGGVREREGTGTRLEVSLNVLGLLLLGIGRHLLVIRSIIPRLALEPKLGLAVQRVRRHVMPKLDAFEACLQQRCATAAMRIPSRICVQVRALHTVVAACAQAPMHGHTVSSS